MSNTNFLTTETFSLRVEAVYAEAKGAINYIDALLVVCDDLGVDDDEVSSLLSPTLRDKLEAEAVDNRTISKANTTTKLSFD